jgi:hypothetical protein
VKQDSSRDAGNSPVGLLVGKFKSDEPHRQDLGGSTRYQSYELGKSKLVNEIIALGSGVLT